MGIVALVTFITVFSSCGSAQKTSSSPVEIKSAIDNDSWRFTATRANPMGGSSRQLTTDYWVELSKGNAAFALPYFGQAYGAGGSYPAGKGPLDFTTSQFSLDKQPKNNGATQITLKPRDNTDVLSATFTFFDNGNATLDLVMSGRSSISYSGKVEAVK